MPKFTEKVDTLRLPVFPLKGMVAFPSIPISFEASDNNIIHICEQASASESMILLLSVKNAESSLSEDNFHAVGTVAKLKQLVKLPEGSARVFVEGVCRASVVSVSDGDEGFSADVICKTIHIEDNGGIRGEALVHEINTIFDSFAKYLPKLSSDLTAAVKTIRHPGLLSDFIACNILINHADKQQILEEFEPLRRAELLVVLMEKEKRVLDTELSIHTKVRERLEANQREYYLKEQLKVIKSELGCGDDADGEIEEYYDKIDSAGLPDNVYEKLESEVKKLARTPYNSAESGVIRNYLDLCLEIPWKKRSRDRINVEAARKKLDHDHYGLEKVKERILEYIAVKQLNPELKNQILCLVGPPGTGKTSIAASLAAAMGRKYVRVSLGGIRDEADIRGHRKTYIGSMPGRIINALKQAGTMNPLILLDELDKLTHDAHGDPASALLEVLDSEQNKNFRDHFLEMPVDLSECIFIATANTMDTVPRPLADRMEIIELNIYTRHEKLAIAKQYLIPKQLKRHGLSRRTLRIDDDAIFEIIDYYTREAGVRNLEREIAAVCRKTAKKIVEGEAKSFRVKAENVRQYLGVRKAIPDRIYENDEVGVVNGLAYTEIGGDMLRIEVSAMPGTGKIELTGSLGDVMKESAKAAVSYIRAHAAQFGIDPDFYKTKDLHIHVPEGAVPKDGPSAGVTMVTAIVSELGGYPVRRDVAMTGEITLRGRVLAIGGLKEKTMAAYLAGAKTVLIPKDNVRDLEEIDPLVKENLSFIPCSAADDVIREALIMP